MEQFCLVLFTDSSRSDFLPYDASTVPFMGRGRFKPPNGAYTIGVGPYFAVKGLNFFRYFAGKGAKFREIFAIFFFAKISKFR